MAEQKNAAVEQATAAPGERRSVGSPAAKRSLKPAAESSDAAVHQLLAQRQDALATGDDAAATRVTEQLADLGYE